MDRSIEHQVTKARNRKTTIFLVAGLLILCTAIGLLRSFFSSSLKQSQIITAKVEVGNIENTINAAGEVLPEFEEMISSPINATIKKVLMDAGTPVKMGQSILMLDKSVTRMEYEKLKFQLESKQNDIRKIKLDLDKSFYDIKSNNSIKQLKINSLKADVENAKRLLNAGGGTRESIEQAELNLQVAQLEKKQLENEISNKQQTMRLQIKEVELLASIQQGELTELSRKLQQADILAGRSGVVTWVNKNIGAVVQPGEVIARVADLSSFKIKGTIADHYIDQLKIGMTAVIRINDLQVRGKVVNIYPAVQNGIVSFDIQPDDRNSKLFRSNLKADVFLVTAQRNQVMRVSNGAAFKGSETEYIYVIKDGVAERRLVKTGMSNFDYIELKDQVNPGDVVITSDMSGFKNSTDIKILP